MPAGGVGSALVGGLLALNLYPAVLILLRARFFRVPVYRPMLLNLGLSWMPLVIVAAFWVGTFLLVSSASELAWGPALVVAFVAGSLVMWTAFFPNASYLITELNFSHRKREDPVPLWYDIIQTLSLTMAGIANATASLVAVQVTFVLLAFPNAQEVTDPAASWALAGLLLVLGSVGVYVGRFVRANSWDLVKPARLFRILAAHLRQPGQVWTAVAFVTTYTLFLAIIYVPTFLIVTGVVFPAG